MSEKNPKFVYFKFLGKKQVQVSKEQWEADWKIWHKRITKDVPKDSFKKNKKK